MWANACLLAHSAALKFDKAFLINVNHVPLHTSNIERLNRQIEREGYHHFFESDGYGARAMTRTHLVVGEPEIEMETPPRDLYSRADARQHIQWAIACLDVLIVEAKGFVEEHAPGVRERLKEFD